MKLYIRDANELRLAIDFKDISRRELAKRCKCSHTLIYKLEHGIQPRTDEAVAKRISRELELDWRSVFSATRPSDMDQSVNRSQPTADSCARTRFSIDGSAGS